MGSQHSSDIPAHEKVRQSFRDEAAVAWRDYVKTGRHATQADLDTWIDSLDPRRPK